MNAVAYKLLLFGKPVPDPHPHARDRDSRRSLLRLVSPEDAPVRVAVPGVAARNRATFAGLYALLSERAMTDGERRELDHEAARAMAATALLPVEVVDERLALEYFGPTLSTEAYTRLFMLIADATDRYQRQRDTVFVEALAQELMTWQRRRTHREALLGLNDLARVCEVFAQMLRAALRSAYEGKYGALPPAPKD
jgi:hypothetical protein